MMETRLALPLRLPENSLPQMSVEFFELTLARYVDEIIFTDKLGCMGYVLPVPGMENRYDIWVRARKNDSPRVQQLTLLHETAHIYYKFFDPTFLSGFSDEVRYWETEFIIERKMSEFLVRNLDYMESFWQKCRKGTFKGKKIRCYTSGV